MAKVHLTKSDLVISMEAPESENARRICTEILPAVLESFFAKNADYGETSDSLGVAGQFAELWRKIGKLRGPMWEGKVMCFEQPDEIVSDLIGHCLLTLLYMADADAEEEA